MQVEALANETVVSVACGAYHSLAVTSSGRLYEWGLIHTEPVSLGPRMVSNIVHTLYSIDFFSSPLSHDIFMYG